MILFGVFLWIVLGLISILLFKATFRDNKIPAGFALMMVLCGPVGLFVSLISYLDKFKI